MNTLADIKIDSKWIGNKTVVTIIDVGYAYLKSISHPGGTAIGGEVCAYKDSDGTHISTMGDFLLQYKLYTPVYEYKYIQIDGVNANITDGYYANASEIDDSESNIRKGYYVYRLLKSKRERLPK